jgi:hypothetical protein
VFDSFLIPLIFRHGPRSFLLRHVLDSHIRGPEVFDSSLIPFIVDHGPSPLLLRHGQGSKDFYLVDMSSTPLPQSLSFPGTTNTLCLKTLPEDFLILYKTDKTSSHILGQQLSFLRHVHCTSSIFLSLTHVPFIPEYTNSDLTVSNAEADSPSQKTSIDM